jgi:hypothetical protein
MRLLLTSAGIATYSTREALVDLLGKPLEESTAIQIPTAIYTLLGSTASANSRNGCVPAPRGPRPTSCSRPSAGGVTSTRPTSPSP